MGDLTLSFILDQISTFLREESGLSGRLRNEVQQIRDELGQMKGFLRGSEAVIEHDPSLKEWVSQLRDIAYDSEDVLDEFSLRFGHHYGHGFLGRVRKASSSLSNLKARHQLATKMHIIKDRIKNISDAHQRYQSQNNHDNTEPGSSSVVIQSEKMNTWYDSRGDALLLEEEDLVGIERPKKKLMDMLPTSDSELHVISVIGMGGLGKTTLVKKVYDDVDVKSRFKHHIWIIVSQSFKAETLLINAIRQLFKELNQSTPNDLDTMDIHEMKQLVRELLHEEKFILVFDDIWRTTDWDALRSAFPRNNCGSLIILTTRNTKVGETATSNTSGDIYPLEPLTREESWGLFCKKTFGSTICPSQLEDISRQIIERCDGLPLAIVVIGGVLATKRRRIEEWELFNRSLHEQLVGDDQLENMIKLLSLSYYDLPDYLKNCFLYLSILPEDASIQKSRLVRLWIAEGFVLSKDGMTKEEVAEAYLNELVNRSLVQVAKRASDERVKECRVHDIILQIILRKAKEHDITTILSEEMMQSSNKVRRLVIHNTTENTCLINGLPKCLRSLILFEFIESTSKSSLSKLLSGNLKLLKVLDLQGAPLKEIPNEIFKFKHLKYLSLRKTNVEIVPKLIEKLQKLETLDLKYTRVKNLPIEILKLQQLRHLIMGKKYNGVQFAYNIGNLKALQSLRHIDVEQTGDVKILTEIGKLTQLRKLGITELNSENGKELCSSIEKLTNLRSLYIRSRYYRDFLDLEYSFSSVPRFLHSLKLVGRLENIPQWIVSLNELTKIHLYGSHLREDPLPLLHQLPNLVHLNLSDAYEGEVLYFKAGGFQELKILSIESMDGLRWVRVEKGAMPFLKDLRLWFCTSVEELPNGIEHLMNLQIFDMWEVSDIFVKYLEDMEEESEDRKKIAHIPRVRISHRVSDAYETRYL